MRFLQRSGRDDVVVSFSYRVQVQAADRTAREPSQLEVGEPLAVRDADWLAGDRQKLALRDH